MNTWSRLLLHLRRASLRSRFMKEQQNLKDAFRAQLLSDTAEAKRRWHDVEWISEPILHVMPDAEEMPIALVGVAAMYSLVEDDDKQPQVQTQTGTALFYFQENAWQTNGKVLLNLTPSEALNQLDLKATCRAQA
jgi:hypothetical protein